jgi:hypothetical protein
MSTVQATFRRTGHSVEGLPVCSWREPTMRPGTYYCRHSSVHVAHDLVDHAICQFCKQFERPVLLPRALPPDPLKSREPPTEPLPLEYVSLERLATDVRFLVGQLPADVSAVAGIPRSGMLPAAQIALVLHLPLLELCPRRGLREIGHGTRLDGPDLRAGPLLIIDDSVCSGQALAVARQQLEIAYPEIELIFAAVYPTPQAIPALDFYVRALPMPHLFEWNLFNCLQAKSCALDFDGILCVDWPGGNEDGEEYQEFLETARPRWLPRFAPVPLIATARLEKHRPATQRWLTRYGVSCERLVMARWDSTEARGRNYHAGEHKGTAYAKSACALFIESDESQAELIFQVAKKPVLCPAAERVFQ